MAFDWIDKLRHLLQTLAFALAISALQFALTDHGSYGVPTSYALAIATSTWALIDFGRHLFPSASETGWPQGWTGVLLPTGGIVVGFVIGTLAADAWLGRSTWTGGRLPVSILISVVAGVVINYYFYSHNKSRYLERRVDEAHAQATAARLKLLETQLEPHMLFNTLANLRVLIGVEPARAQAMLDRLIAFLRATLNASRVEHHALSAEFDRVADYLGLMAVRMGPRLQVKLELPAELRTLQVPPLLLQPLVENCIKHGLEPKVEGGLIELSAQLTEGMLHLVVRDTGVGLAATSAATTAGTHFGLEQVRSRLTTLYGSRAGLVVRAAHDERGGTEAVVSLPLGVPPQGWSCPPP